MSTIGNCFQAYKNHNDTKYYCQPILIKRLHTKLTDAPSVLLGALFFKELIVHPVLRQTANYLPLVNFLCDNDAVLRAFPR